MSHKGIIRKGWLERVGQATFRISASGTRELARMAA
jgi:DNA-binding PadR family transcriptional regulator